MENLAKYSCNKNYRNRNSRLSGNSLDYYLQLAGNSSSPASLDKISKPPQVDRRIRNTGCRLESFRHALIRAAFFPAAACLDSHSAPRGTSVTSLHRWSNIALRPSRRNLHSQGLPPKGRNTSPHFHQKHPPI